MKAKEKILAFSGSNSSTSINQRFVTYVAKKMDLSVEVENFKDLKVPLYCFDREGEPLSPDLEFFIEMVEDFDAFIISVPEHNGMPPAFFKNILDWCSRVKKNLFAGKKVLLLSASPGGRGAISSRDLTENLLKRQGAEVVAKYSLASFGTNFRGGELVPEEEEILKEQIDLFRNCLNSEPEE